MTQTVSLYLNDRDQSNFVFTVDNADKDVAVTDSEQFLLITHTEGASYFNIASVQFFEILTEETAQ